MIKFKKVVNYALFLLFAILIVLLFIGQSSLQRKLMLLEQKHNRQILLSFKQAEILALNTVAVKHLLIVTKGMGKKGKAKLELKDLPPITQKEKMQ